MGNLKKMRLSVVILLAFIGLAIAFPQPKLKTSSDSVVDKRLSKFETNLKDVLVQENTKKTKKDDKKPKRESKNAEKDKKGKDKKEHRELKSTAKKQAGAGPK